MVCVGIYVELRDETGDVVAGLPDPSGGIFDAAGDFDRFIDRYPYNEAKDGLPVLESLDPYGTTVTPSGVMAKVISECVRATALATDGPERRGLLRLRTLAEECSRRPGSALHWIGD
ncbi:hypothetical protein ASF35_04010 [Aeromicrobium sp. Leaf291]|nr:hypothetical protein ASF35_04010 [Aeromicrobium sp. Leaf291]